MKKKIKAKNRTIIHETMCGHCGKFVRLIQTKEDKGFIWTGKCQNQKCKSEIGIMVGYEKEAGLFPMLIGEK